MNIQKLTAIVVLMCIVSSATGQGLNQVLLAYLDYDEFHKQFVARCNVEYSDKVPALRTAIEHWSSINLPAVRDLQLVLNERLIQQGIPASEVASRAAATAAKVNAFMLGGLPRVSPSELRDMCSGQYALQLTKPEMDYVSLLQRARAEVQK